MEATFFVGKTFRGHFTESWEDRWRNIALAPIELKSHRPTLPYHALCFAIGSESTPIPFPNEIRNSCIRLRQRSLIRQEHDAEMLGARLLAEA